MVHAVRKAIEDMTRPACSDLVCVLPYALALQATGDVMVVCVTPLVMRVESAEASSHATNPKQLALLSASLVGRGVVSALKQLQLISCSELTRVR